MSFDDLFGLLLFVVFIALPALSRMARSRRQAGGGAPGQGAPTPGRTRTASTARPTASTSGGGASSAAGGGDELERRLAEARERVRRALEGSGEATSSPSQQRSASSAQQPSAPKAQPSSTAARPTPVRRTAFVTADRDDGLLSTPLDPSAVGGLGRKRPADRARPAPFDEAPALQVERPGARHRSGPREARVSAAFATDPETIRSAIVWHQVLGEPRARRPLGGRPSTLRSR